MCQMKFIGYFNSKLIQNNDVKQRFAFLKINKLISHITF